MMTERIAGVRHFRAGVVAIGIALLVAIGLGTTIVYVKTENSRNNCHAINDDRAIMREILHRFEPPETHPSDAFRLSLAELAPRDCN